MVSRPGEALLRPLSFSLYGFRCRKPFFVAQPSGKMVSLSYEMQKWCAGDPRRRHGSERLARRVEQLLFLRQKLRRLDEVEIFPGLGGLARGGQQEAIV